MGAGKKGFVVYFDIEAQTAEFSDEQVGQLFRAMLAFASRGEVAEIEDPLVKIAFSFVRVQIREDREKYEKKCLQNQENGSKGGRPPKKQT